MPDRFSFIPHAQTQLAAVADSPTSGNQRLQLEYDLEIRQNGNPSDTRETLSAKLRGPGDVATLDTSAILHTDPRPGLRGFEPNYFPLIAFKDADLPWRYSLDTGGETRKTPWLALIVLQAEEFSFVETQRGPLKRIRIIEASASLPDPATLWATAHVHVDHLDANTDAAATLGSAPERAFSRVMCMRQLFPTKTYYAFVVPTYEAGRRAGLGESGTATPYDAFAWSLQAEPVDMPVYYDWRFTTDASEDVEILLRRLTALDEDALSDLLGDSRVSAARPGYYGKDFPGAAFQQQSAMKIPSEPLGDVDTPKDLRPLMVETLTTTITQGDTETGEDPLVAFPAYGFRFKPETDISSDEAEQNVWFDRINLDLKFRHAAGLGAALMRANQERFANQAWAQYEEIVAANAALARLQAAEVLATNLTDRHFRPLDSDVALSLAEPLGAAVAVSDTQNLRDFLSDRGVPLTSMARTMRRIAAKHGQVRLRGATRFAMPPIPGNRAEKEVSKEPEKDPAASAPPVLQEEVLTAHGPLKGFEKSVSALFGNLDLREVARPTPPAVSVATFSADELKEPVANILTKLPRAKAQVGIPGRSPVEKGGLHPVWRAPTIAAPMAAFLQQFDTDALFAGSDALPDNTIAVLEENRPFVEAFLVGLNHEMHRELRWREFPTDMRGTIFRRFWDRGYAAGDPRGDDIGPIHEWNEPLGRNVPPTATNAEENLIVMIRGDIIRKLEDPILAINIAGDDGGFAVGSGTNYPPIFMGRIGRDTVFYGFEISREEVLQTPSRSFFVLHEPAGRLRFGLDVGRMEIRQWRRDEAAIAHGFDLTTTQDMVYRPRQPYEGQPDPNETTAIPIPSLTEIQSWDELSWSTIDPIAPSGYIDFSDNRPTNLDPNYLGVNRTSASLARAFWQKPVAGVLPLARVLK